MQNILTLGFSISPGDTSIFYPLEHGLVGTGNLVFCKPAVTQIMGDGAQELIQDNGELQV